MLWRGEGCGRVSCKVSVIVSVLKKAITLIQCLRFGINREKGMWIHPFCQIVSPIGRVFCGQSVSLHNAVRIDCDEKGKVILKKGCMLNVGTRIESMDTVILEECVLTGPYVYISDRSHQYRDISQAVMFQGYYSNGGVVIGEGSWLGIHAVVLGPVTIGKHCVIGANSVVIHDIPDYSVAVGNPARIVKRYDLHTRQWTKFDKEW